MASSSAALRRRLLGAVASTAALACSREGGVAARGPIQSSIPTLRFDAAAPPASALPPFAALPRCSATFFIRNPTRTGGPSSLSACYRRGPSSPPSAACLPGGSPRMVEAIPQTQYASCVERGPEEQTDAATGESTCCYVFGTMGEGRPFLVWRSPGREGSSPRGVRIVAALSRSAAQKAWA
jgi:hypothetical protein